MVLAESRKRQRHGRGREQAAERAGNQISAGRPHNLPRHVADEAETREEEHERPQHPRPDGVVGAERASGQERQDHGGHDRETRAGANLLAVEPLHPAVQSLLLDEKQSRDGRNAGRQRTHARAGQHAGHHHDERRDLRRAVDVGPAGREICHDHERTEAGEKHDGRTLGAGGPQPAAQARDEPEQRERPNAREPRARPACLPTPLALDTNRNAAESGDRDVDQGALVERRKRHGSAAPA